MCEFCDRRLTGFEEEICVDCSYDLEQEVIRGNREYEHETDIRGNR